MFPDGSASEHPRRSSGDEKRGFNITRCADDRVISIRKPNLDLIWSWFYKRLINRTRVWFGRHHAAYRTGVRGSRHRWTVRPAVARGPAVVPSGIPALRSALVRLLALPERPGSGPQEHPVRLLHRRQEQEDPAAAGESHGQRQMSFLLISLLDVNQRFYASMDLSEGCVLGEEQK